ncbi:MAG: hypothetical protein HGA85_06815 [Nanoarchaeota archaeon]|nr:hypothetical protein [Nanoarchaeota archaeon]
MDKLVSAAFSSLYPEKDVVFDAEIKYSRAFSGFNAKVIFSRTKMEFRLSHKWKEMSDDLKIGLIQSLLNKVHKTKIKTMEIELYEIFTKKLSSYSEVNKSDPVLEESFKRVNEEYFHGMIMQPNLEWSGDNLRTLGTYDHSTDTIRITKVLEPEPALLDYVMYHEMLHKKLKYKESGSRTIHHPKEFRRQEALYKVADIEKKLKEFLRKRRLPWFLR